MNSNMEQRRIKLKMQDPTFGAGTSHTARAPVSNPTPASFTYDAELYLAISPTAAKVATSGIVTFTLAGGASGIVDFPLTMPGVEGTFHVYLDVLVAGELIAAYIAIEDVIITVSPEIIIDPITWD